MRRCVNCLLLLVVSVCASGCANAASPVRTLCDLVANPGRYANKVVRVKAIYITDMLEHSALLDPSCRSAHISLYDGPKGPYQGSINKFNNALAKARLAGSPDIFRVEFSAVFRVKPEPTELPFSKGEQGRLHLTRVWHYSWLPKVPPNH